MPPVPLEPEPERIVGRGRNSVERFEDFDCPFDPCRRLTKRVRIDSQGRAGRNTRPDLDQNGLQFGKERVHPETG